MLKFRLLGVSARRSGTPLRPAPPARAHAVVALLGTWFSLASPRKVSFTAVQRRLAEDQIAAPLKANSRLSEGVNISQRVTSVLFIMNIFSLLSGDLPTLRSHKTSPRPCEGRLRLSSPPAIPGDPASLPQPRLPSGRGGCLAGAWDHPRLSCSKGHLRREIRFKRSWRVMCQSKGKLQ